MYTRAHTHKHANLYLLMKLLKMMLLMMTTRKKCGAMPLCIKRNPIIYILMREKRRKLYLPYISILIEKRKLYV